MGDITDAIMDGELCEACQVWLGPAVGYPRMCDDCTIEVHALARRPMTTPRPSDRTTAPFRVDRHARNEAELQQLMQHAQAGDQPPAGGSSYHDGVMAALRYVNGGDHPYQQPAPDPQAVVDGVEAERRRAADSGPQPTPPAAAPTGTTPVPPTTAGGGGTGTTGAGAMVR